METTLRLLGGAFLILVNFFFVATEFALTRFSQGELQEKAEGKPFQIARRITDRLEVYLTGCQVGITLSSIALGIVAEPAVTGLLEPWVGLTNLGPGRTHLISIIFTVIILNIVHMVLGEQVPTYLGVERPLLVIRWFARTHYLWTKLMSPFIWAGDRPAKFILGLFGVEMTRSWKQDEAAPVRGKTELRKAMMKVLAGSELRKDRQEEVLKAVEIEELPVERIMTSIDEVVVLYTRDSPETNLEKICDGGYVRFPVVGATIDDFRGVIYVPSLLKKLDELCNKTFDLEELVSEPLTFPHDLPVSQAIDRFQEEREEAALVKRDGKAVGFVTVTDSLEAIIGELRDPLD